MRRGAFALALASISLVSPEARAQEGLPAPIDPAVAIERLAALGSNHPYLPLARYTLEQVQRQAAGQEVRSAVLVERVSLIEPKAIECSSKPPVILIDLDAAPGDTIIEGEPSGFGLLLQLLRDAGIAIAWISERTPAMLEEDVAALRRGSVPAFRDEDIQLPAWSGPAKQDRRLALAASHCVIAIAGDRRGDFDILFDYLRDPDYAIRLEAWMDRGWFLLPYPASVADSDPVAPETATPDTSVPENSPARKSPETKEVESLL